MKTELVQSKIKKDSASGVDPSNKWIHPDWKSNPSQDWDCKAFFLRSIYGTNEATNKLFENHCVL